MAFSKGDIVWVEYDNRYPKKLRHPAVVWEYTDDETDFLGIMLTHARPGGKFDNILMLKTHFLDGEEVSFSDTHFVNQLFIKFQGWGPFYKAGSLTDIGTEFIAQNLKTTAPISFDNYIKPL